MAHGDHLKYQAKPKAGRQTLFRLTSYLVCDRLFIVCHRRFDRAEYCR